MDTDFAKAIRFLIKFYLITLIVILFLYLFFGCNPVNAQVEVKQNERGLYAIGTTPQNKSFVISEIQNENEIFEFLDNKLNQYVAGALVYEPKYNITIRVFPLYKDKVLILYKGKYLDRLNFPKQFCYYKQKIK